jgi:hypothetical protein
MDLVLHIVHFHGSMLLYPLLRGQLQGYRNDVCGLPEPQGQDQRQLLLIVIVVYGLIWKGMGGSGFLL